MTIENWLEEATPDRREISVCFDRRLLSDLVAARRELEAVEDPKMLGKTPERESLELRVLELEDAVRSKHPPEAEQASVFAQAVQLGFMPHAVENVGYNAETLVPAAISASCVEPGISVHEASTLLRKAPPGVIERIWTAVLEVNVAGGADPFVAPASAGRSAAARPSAKK